MPAQVFAAVDIGASGGRVMAGRVETERVTLETVHRFDNGVVERDGHLRWDLSRIYGEMLVGLANLPDAESIGIDTWGVDYGLLGDAGELLAEPIAYRDNRTAAVIDEVHELVTPNDLYKINGLQLLPFTTLYQLAAERLGPCWERAHRAVLLPDLLAYWLTGVLATEATNASTTGLLDVHNQQWSADLFDRLGLPSGLLPPIESPGHLRGTTTEGTPVTTVGSHDTASAVVAIPATTRHFAYVVSGTWSLVGLELEGPVVTEASREANFTNETGVDGRTRFLRNVGGLWLLQECMRSWGRNDLGALLETAGTSPSTGTRIDVDDPSFIPPGRMPDRIAQAAGRHDMGPAEITRCILDSLAEAYARTVRQAAALAGSEVEVIHIVGGGSQNELLCQLTADAANLPVVAGPVEATALGNVLVQARAHGSVDPSLEAMRELVATSNPLRRYAPS